jgi:putative tricarboxylic transport membrane protein
MDILSNLALGLSVCANPIVLLYALIGVTAGIVIGALPGLGPGAGIAVLLPMTYGMNPVAGIVMLAGIYYGAMYGGSISAILINTPGDGAAVITTLDGYPLAKRGEPARAMGMALFASLTGGTIGAITFMVLAPIIARYALAFGPSEYFALMILRLATVAGLTGKSRAKGFLAGALGLFISTIGIDLVLGSPRYAFNNVSLYNGINFIPVAMGLFGVTEIITPKDNVHEINISRDQMKLGALFPKREDWKICMPHILRSTCWASSSVFCGRRRDHRDLPGLRCREAFLKIGEDCGTGSIEGVSRPLRARITPLHGSMCR